MSRLGDRENSNRCQSVNAVCVPRAHMRELPRRTARQRSPEAPAGAVVRTFVAAEAVRDVDRELLDVILAWGSALPCAATKPALLFRVDAVPLPLRGCGELPRQADRARHVREPPVRAPAQDGPLRGVGVRAAPRVPFAAALLLRPHARAGTAPR